MALVFDGDRIGAEQFLRSASGYYVYMLCRPDGAPFYVGKGTKRRVLEHELEALRCHPIGESNPIKCNVIRKIHRHGLAVRYQIDSVYEASCELDCLQREAALIAQFRRLHEGGCLTNLAGGMGSVAGPAPSSLARHSATLSGEPASNPDRAILNRFLQSIGPVGSVPVKPIHQIARILPTTPHPSARRATSRNAYALMASASACGLAFAPGVQVPRSFTYQGVSAIIENGVARDILKAGLAGLIASANPQGEAFELSGNQIALLIGLVGHDTLMQRGLI